MKQKIRNIICIFDALDGLPVLYADTINVFRRVGSRLPDQRTAYLARDGPSVIICVAVTAVTVKRTRNSAKEYPATTKLYVVHIFEPQPPKSQKPIEWILLTNEPCSTEEENCAVVECFRQRSLIEELNKAIKRDVSSKNANSNHTMH